MVSNADLMAKIQAKAGKTNSGMPSIQKAKVGSSENKLANGLSGSRDVSSTALSGSALTRSLEKAGTTGSTPSGEISATDKALLFENNSLQASFKTKASDIPSVFSAGVDTSGFNVYSEETSFNSEAYSQAQGHFNSANSLKQEADALMAAGDMAGAKSKYSEAIKELNKAYNQLKSAQDPKSKALRSQISLNQQLYQNMESSLKEKLQMKYATASDGSGSCSSSEDTPGFWGQLWGSITDGSLGGALNSVNSLMNGGGGSQPASAPAAQTPTEQKPATQTPAAQTPTAKPVSTPRTQSMPTVSRPSNTSSTTAYKLEYDKEIEAEVKKSTAPQLTQEANNEKAAAQKTFNEKSQALKDKQAIKAQLEAQITDKLGEVGKSAMEKYNNLLNEQAKLDGEAKALRAEEKEQKELATQLGEKITANSKKLQGLNVQLGTAKSNLESANRTVTMYQNQLKDATPEQQAQIQANLETALVKQEQAQKAYDDKQKEVDALNRETESLKESQTAATTKATEAGKNAKTKEDEAAKKGEEAKLAKGAASAADKKLANDLEQVNKEIIALQSEVANAQAQMDAADAKFAAAEAVVDSVERTYAPNVAERAWDGITGWFKKD